MRSVLFAKGLSQQDAFRVSFMIADTGKPSDPQIQLLLVPARPTCIDQAVQKSYARFSRTRYGSATSLARYCDPRLLWDVPLLALHKYVLRYLFERPQPRKIYRQPDTDVFCCFGLDEPGGADLAATCEQTRSPLIVFIIHDGEVSPHVRPGGGLVPGTFVNGDRGWFVLSRATHIIVQSESQLQQARQRFGSRVTLIRNPIDLDNQISWDRGAGHLDSGLPVRLPQAQRFVLWIGRSETSNQNHKRPDAYWELARRCPEVPFVAVLNVSNPDRFNELVRTKPPNLEVIRHVPYGQIDAVFRRAGLLVNTSSAEGFPNTFLQAGKHSVPIVSLAVDPDSILKREGWGVVCDDDLEHMADAVRRLWNDAATLQTMGSRGRAYVEREHDLGDRVAQLAALVAGIVSGSPMSGT